ncbi:MAG TPA: DUF1697 domain-containing protein [Actinospica sp.]|nr:DUF1697 domain-containing protein [Actinospica sp.]
MARRYAALLASVNVGRRRVPMAQLRELLDGLGYTQVQTYLASGNAVFSTQESADDAAAKITAALEKGFGFAIPTLVRDAAYLEAVIKACPFPADEVEGRFLHAVFHSEQVSEERFSDIDRAAFLPEEFRIGERVMYLHLPGGIGRSALAAALVKPASRLRGVIATGRNWNTVKALAEMTG